MLLSFEPSDGNLTALATDLERRERRLAAGQPGAQREDRPSASRGMDLLRLPLGERSAARWYEPQSRLLRGAGATARTTGFANPIDCLETLACVVL